MELFETINTRKTIRKYKPDTIPMDDIEKIINAGRLAPSATNSQNWKFVVIKNKEIIEKMKNAVITEYDNLIKLCNDKEIANKINGYKNYSTFFTNAPILIAIVEIERHSFITEIMNKLNFPLEKIKHLRPDSSLLSMGAAIENMSLAAHALGYGSCWMVAPIIGSEEFSHLLTLNNNEHVISLLPIGIPLQSETLPPAKKSLQEVMRIIN